MRKLLIFFIFFLFFFIFKKEAFAEKNFDISTTSSYSVSEDGITSVTQRISITNTSEFYYSPSYSVNIGMKDVENIRVFDSDGAIPSTTKDTENGRSVSIQFNKKVVGLNKTNSFTFSFTTNEIAKKQGNIWEVNIPGIANPENFTKYDTTLSVPKSFGVASITKPTINAGIAVSQFNFTKDQTSKSGIFIIFGETQYYNLKLTYHLDDKNLFPVRTEIALPPTTPYQEVVVENIAPAPINVSVDPDGNWLAKYDLLPGKQKTIIANIFVKVKARPEGTESLKSENLYTKTQPYWDVSDNKIQSIAQSLKTPRAIYDYVVRKLSYNYNKVASENVRLGAKKVLDNPSDAVCLEFTDLFIALARASGIPARSVEGYAFTSNNKLRPLSLVKDILHAWPEYYDFETKRWVMVDPTWGNTTFGMDYYDSLDFDHIVFAIKGRNSVYPVPAGGYKIDKNSQDVDVSFFDPSKFKPKNTFEVVSNFPKFSISGFPINGSYVLKNTGNSLLQAQSVIVGSELLKQDLTFSSSPLPPYGSEVQEVNLGKTSILTNRTYKVKINSSNLSLENSINVGIIPNYMWILIGGGLILGTLFIGVAIKTRSILIQRRKQEDSLRGKGKGS